MGVPQLFRWITDRFGKRVAKHRGRKLHPTFKVTADYLYFDGNASLHPAAQKVFSYGDRLENLFGLEAIEQTINPYANLTYEERLRKVFEVWVDGLVYSSQMVESKVIYIAIDGPAPLAKQAQQRERRFVASPSETGFDSNSITPGTPFMFELTKYMNYAIRKLINGPWKGKTVYFSPGNEPGEGEHKIIDFIRGLPREERESKTHAIVGPDADLIMLALASRCRYIYLVREDQTSRKTQPNKPPDQYVVDISGIAEELPSILHLDPDGSIPQAVNDFVLLGFFLGNDFVPRIRMFQSLREGINHLIKIITNKKLKLTKRGAIDWDGFGALISELACSEARLLAKQANDPANGRNPEHPPNDLRLINHTLLDHITDSSHGPVLDYEGYRQAYYARAGIALKDVPGLCESYLQTLEWILLYYTKGLPSWEHFYPSHYAPMMRDLQRYLSKTKTPTSDFSLGRPSEPFEQLLTVLPPHSSKLLPIEYRRCMFSGELADTYPKEVEFDYEGVGIEHARKVLLPFADIELIRRVYEQANAGADYARNRMGATSVFRYDPEARLTYRSDYGTLRFSRAVKTQLA